MPELLDAIGERIPSPIGDPDAPLQALIFDSQFDQYRGVVSSVRVVNGRLTSGSRPKFMQAGALHEALEIGRPSPAHHPDARARAGEVGYLIAGIKEVGDARSGETVTTASKGATEALSGYHDPKPMVFSGLFPIDGDDFENLREALGKLKLNDASVSYTPESSGALGFGFRCVLKVTADTASVFANYGVTDRLDVGLALPYLRIDMEARIHEHIEKLSTGDEPFVFHIFQNGTDDNDIVASD